MKKTLSDKNILLAVTGGIAAYKATELVRAFVKRGANVKVVMTPSAETFIPAKTLAILSKQDVLTDETQEASSEVAHVKLARWADALVVAPATANTLAKMANGLADNVLTETLLASATPVKIIAPAMNDQMWGNAATQRNVKRLRQDGYSLVEPATGFLAEGYEAKGRLAETKDIVSEVERQLVEKTALDNGLAHLAGQKIVITAGGTREPIDPVRFLTNRSSGKMGYALAEAANTAGADVTLIATVQRDCSANINVRIAESAEAMLQAVQEEMVDTNVFISAAAVSDYRLKEPFTDKVKKQGDDDGLTLNLVQNPDILKTVGMAKKPGQIVVGFAAETKDLLANAKAKLSKKNADMIVGNDVTKAGAGFDQDTNVVTMVRPEQDPVEEGPASKLNIAKAILNQVVKIQEMQ
ncbi:bifunctional phosphopantothenoylcysteine decarboxylase/phosphopantothenate--cysteine ligase CoaBC [Fructobacillus sp. M2-14]|uniref:Coenzyme A biosynthesis bifunctional protein CoaBC n=1 Tax=Fructobacillus broussonetiae TaxID=2713173 RepID=A0ABS5QYK8_9LACO|nr:bifunctional phosphopantothenoylcysteine decarboxylase/phosphopantothenate--cysteine ligase CoaBC [Fructobacillus broussonetiae]MBS9338275.1 bifunctional phosphopantothenoylcysteine decarboxylase/phosphopantothenate--cysteine ligase CoaBC [Fructobacillus broussonetiae]